MMSSPVAATAASPPAAVSLIVPVYRGGADFRRCLAQLFHLSPPAAEVIVVVDGADEDDGSGAAAEAAGARVIYLPQRSGPAAARNAGARLASGELLLFVDADVVPNPALVAQVQAVFATEPHLAALIGSYDDAPGATSFLSQYRNLLHHYVHQTAEPQATTFWGACGAVRRQVFWAVGGFDENYTIPAMEDVELGYRLNGAGYVIRLCRDIQVQHLKHWSALNLLRTDIFQRAIPWAQLLRRGGGRLPNDLNLRIGSRVSAVLAWLLVALLLAGSVWPLLWYGAVAAAVGLLGLNAPLYRFFQQKRGWLFTLGVLPWHWLYYLYSSAAFAWVVWNKK